ncbi:type IV pilus modification protein PilV [Pseudomonas sp. 10B1]|uniref:type IV pilus modification protein PilV n=1 Tax=unclassified Pseudomonas TaxID=196821 RepID=UPI002AB4C60B|nr:MULTISPECIES: type IV pilus modification protein PilV [unclassified Pseudomonas]MDY7561916.1 type IV pilus modification protein PilV [Pseudomonas sp. AB6]MEA9976056.1 type IV pilus modification protein PilV [Pseudomonas sp. RTS4]MEA9993438.1 type IV pilus modification protein PilV [Pseudomonas sp. AA4]MEB0088958.1 type IV pilus modification protein PilV [Pseudomonas sp. RTI1]MEB0126289.1 type IV pilus modification protein PilV [Pseudomonas sp. CCC1.2]
MADRKNHAQAGTTLVEVLISVLVLAIGLLGAAAIQLNALKYTDSSTLSSQASFVAYDMMDRIRANPDVDYSLAVSGAAPTANISVAHDQDLADFSANVAAFAGAGSKRSITVVGREVTIAITWLDTRATSSANADNTASTATSTQSFILTSRVAIDLGIP